MSMSNGEPWIVWGDHTTTYGETVRVGQPMSDLNTHVVITGTTGSGKSTALRNLALQFADNGGTVIVIEPHGDLILHPHDGILPALSDEQLRRTALIDLAAAWPPQMNLVRAGLSAGTSVAVKTTMNCVRVMDDASWKTAILMREILENALELLLSVEGELACLLLLQKFLTDAPYRTSVLKRAGPEAIEARDYWQRTLAEWETAKGGGAATLAVPLRRVGQFLRDARFRRSLSLPLLAPEQALHVGQLMDDPEARIILVPLQAPKLGDEAKRVFGTLFMQDVTNAFLARAALDKQARRPTLLIIDEFADLAGGAVGELVTVLLAQARKFGASVVLGTQFMAQLPAEVQSEVRGNCNNKVVLATEDPRDAKAVVESLATNQLTPLDVQTIEKWHGYARFRVHGAPQPPVYFRSLAPLPAIHSAPVVIAHRRARPRNMGDLHELHQLAAADPLDAREAIERLVRLSESAFGDVVKRQVEANAYGVEELLAGSHELTQVQRALSISRAQHGLPWWMYEAQYRRLRF